MEPFRDDDLAAALSALRPAPRPAFAAELDERAAAGFPRRDAGGSSPLAAFAAWLRAQRPRRLLIPAGAIALVALVAVTAVVATSGPTSPENPGGGSGSNLLSEFTPINPSQDAPAASAGSAAAGESAGATSGSSSSGTEYQAQPSAAKAETGPFASQAGHREVERSAQMVLATESDEVGAAAAKVFDAVHANDGIVLRSSTSGGESARASFDLLIPSAKLNEALAAFSAIAEVRGRHEATADVTARTVGLGERLQDARATVAGLLKQLAAAESATARSVAEAELRSARLRVAGLRSRLAAIERRTNLSRVSLRIESGATSSSGSGSWGAGDALGDAGHILGIAAGVAIVGLAIIGPLALIALLAWLLNRARLRRGRERALG